jgi:hypothetical protein
MFGLIKWDTNIWVCGSFSVTKTQEGFKATNGKETLVFQDIQILESILITKTNQEPVG